jgi:hypothetical protein
MAIDVLEYNRLVIPNYNANYANLANAITLANTTYYQPNYNTANALAYSNTAFYYINQAIVPTLNNNPLKQNTYGIFSACGLYSTPWCCSYWAAISDLPSGTIAGNFKVCDTTYFRCGASCNWVVPAGVTYARFQLWGAGAGSHGMCCCGGGIWGGSGAYASAILPVTPGTTYCICAGCAYCCYMSDAGYTSGGGCASFVVGPGLYNFCAEGGEPSPYCWLQRANGKDGQTVTFDGYCVLMNASTRCNKISKGTVYGWCMCGGGGFCFGSNCTGNDVIPFTTSTKSFYGSVTTPTRVCHYVIGANGMFNAAGLDFSGAQDACRCLFHPPIVNLTCCCCGKSMSSFTFDFGCCYRACDGFFQFPSRGGYPSSVCGGYNNCGGGIGAMGMVCVTWICSA